MNENMKQNPQNFFFYSHERTIKIKTKNHNKNLTKEI